MSRIQFLGWVLGFSLFAQPATTLLAADQPAAKPAEKPAAKPTATAEVPKPRIDTPTLADVPYGEHPKQVLDFYQAESKEPPIADRARRTARFVWHILARTDLRSELTF